MCVISMVHDFYEPILRPYTNIPQNWVITWTDLEFKAFTELVNQYIKLPWREQKRLTS